MVLTPTGVRPMRPVRRARWVRVRGRAVELEHAPDQRLEEGGAGGDDADAELETGKPPPKVSVPMQQHTCHRFPVRSCDSLLVCGGVRALTFAKSVITQ